MSKDNKDTKKIEDISKDIKASIHSNDDSMKALLDTVNALRKELEDVKKERFSDSEKKAIEVAREEMITDEDVGPCYLAPDLKMEGYHYRATDLTRPNLLAKRIKQGYEIARYSDTKDLSKSETLDKTSLTDAITVDLGGEHSSRSGVWMRIPLEQYNKRQKVKERINRQNLEDAVSSGSAGASFGEVSVGNINYFKRD